MPLIRYKKICFKSSSKIIIQRANTIIEEYRADGLQLTLRQLYYQFVSRNWLANTEKNYKRLSAIISDGRLAGLIDWYSVIDRTRMLRGLTTWDSPHDIVANAAAGFRVDKWARQTFHIEVWIEKDAILGVVEGVCNRNQIDYFSCRGFTSQSEMWNAAQRLSQYERNIILHLGDHDPSGIDMSRDIEERLGLFMYSGGLDFQRIALNMDQIRQYNPPPNPTKLTDSRAAGYVKQYGNESWELDALEPRVISQLIQDKIDTYRDDEPWEAAVAREALLKAQLDRVTENWAAVVEFLNGRG